MGIPLEEMMARLPAEERRRVEERAQALIAEELTLRDLRKAMGKTQAALAKKLGMKQENISRVEQRTDMLLSTLDKYVKAMGGRLQLTAEFPGRAPVQIAGFTFVKEGAPRSHRGVASKAGARPIHDKIIARTRARETGPAKSEAQKVPARRRTREAAV